MTLSSNERLFSKTPVSWPSGRRSMRPPCRLDTGGVEYLNLRQAPVLPGVHSRMVWRGGVELLSCGNAPFANPGDVDSRHLDPCGRRNLSCPRAHPVLDVADRMQLNDLAYRFS